MSGTVLFFLLMAAMLAALCYAHRKVRRDTVTLLDALGAAHEKLAELRLQRRILAVQDELRRLQGRR